MGRKKIYKSVAEKQRAWRIRTGKQKVKVPLAIRRGEDLGTSEGGLRAKKEGETWESYHLYIKERLNKAVGSKRMSQGAATKIEEGYSTGARRGSRGAVEPEFSEDYYELRAQYEKGLLELDEKRRKKVKEK